MKIFEAVCEDDSRKIAFDLGREASAGDVYAVSGDLGAGKTLMAKEFARGLNVEEEITSPTFTILEEYAGRIPFYHFDLYRINSSDELDALGFEDYFFGNGACWVEWPEKAPEALPENRINLRIEITGDETRRITVEYPADRHVK